MDEVAELAETAAELGRAVDQAAPGVLRPQVLRALRSSRQAPPLVPSGEVPSRHRGFRRAAALVSAACVVAAAVGGVHGALTASTITPVAAPPRTRIGDLLAAPDLRLVTTDEQAGTVAISRSRNEMLVLGHNLRMLPRDRVYQLWLIDDHGPRSAGTTSAAGAVTSLFVSGIEGAGEAVLTVEPLGGSPSPTGSLVLSIVLR
ncbi:anti-sigma factor [Lentzea sp. NPDC102401]|uniref:anti-sigma factor n=1 Tax=Lentzea sp. NPDC102401 TaxID=3364128 RepID=UPI003818CF47